MEGRFSLGADLAAELREKAFGGGFVKLVQTLRRNGRTVKTSLRRVAIGGEVLYQAETRDGGAPSVKNYDREAAAAWFEELIAAEGARDIHLMTATGDLHLRVTRKGRVLSSRSAPLERPAEALPHDRAKDLPLERFDSAAYLQVAGLAGADGAVKASMRGKYRQVNEFLKAVGETLAADNFKPSPDRPLRVVDCGCGKAYLTLALYLYLTRVLNVREAEVVGVDRRADVVAAAADAARRLDIASAVRFETADLADFDAGRADMVVSLHACDTATDEALAKAVEWKARYVLSASCCQHELHKAIGANATFAGLLRQSILRERLGDLLTDAFRALAMRILGYRVQVAEFVAADATARNIMLKCVWGVKPGQGAAVAEYLELRDFWRVKPWLESRLESRLAPLLERYS